jgi:hypothetical protein
VLRRQWFEINDASWAPMALRELELETLSRAMRWGRMLDGLVRPLGELLRQTGATEVLELCAGSGGAAEALLPAFEASGAPIPRIVMTDLVPRVEAWERLQRRWPQHLSFEREPVDVAKVPGRLGAGRVWLVLNALHHFPPQMASGLFHAARREGAGLIVAEILSRELVALLRLAPFGLPALAVSGVLSHYHRLQKAALTFLTPVVLATSLWDASVSALRTYTAGELCAMVPPDWHWELGSLPYRHFGAGSYISGRPS